MFEIRDAMPKPKSRFKPRAEISLLHKIVEQAWQEKQQVAEVQVAEVAERLAQYFESKIPEADLEVLKRYGCIGYQDACNVCVYDLNPDDGIAHYRETFGVRLSRKVPVCGPNGWGYPSLTVADPRAPQPILPELESLLALRKAYRAEYKQSTTFPHEFRKEHGKYPTWAEIEASFPVLGTYIAKKREPGSGVE